MYSQKDGLFPGPESPSPELIFLAGDLARGSLAKCINAPPIGRVWGDTHSGVQAAPLRQHHGVAGILPWQGMVFMKKATKNGNDLGIVYYSFSNHINYSDFIFFSEKEMLLISVDYNYRFYFQIVWSSWTIRKLWVYFEYYHYHFCCSNI